MAPSSSLSPAGYKYGIWNCSNHLVVMKDRPGELQPWWPQHQAIEPISRATFFQNLLLWEEKESPSLCKPLYVGFLIICSLKHFWFIEETTLLSNPSQLLLTYFLFNDSLQTSNKLLLSPSLDIKKPLKLGPWCLRFKSQVVIFSEAHFGSQE